MGLRPGHEAEDTLLARHIQRFYRSQHTYSKAIGIGDRLFARALATDKDAKVSHNEEDFPIQWIENKRSFTAALTKFRQLHTEYDTNNNFDTYPALPEPPIQPSQGPAFTNRQATPEIESGSSEPGTTTPIRPIPIALLPQQDDTVTLSLYAARQFLDSNDEIDSLRASPFFEENEDPTEVGRGDNAPAMASSGGNPTGSFPGGQPPNNPPPSPPSNSGGQQQPGAGVPLMSRADMDAMFKTHFDNYRQNAVADQAQLLASGLAQMPTTRSTNLKATDVGFFDPSLKDSGYGVVSDGNTQKFNNVFIFTDRLKHMAIAHGEDAVRKIWTSCLQGPALMWHAQSLSTLERKMLQQVDVESICDALVERFKPSYSETFSRLQKHRFVLSDVVQGRDISAYVQAVMNDAKALNHDERAQIEAAYQSFDYDVKHEIPRPQDDTKLSTFMSWVKDAEPALREAAQAKGKGYANIYTAPGFPTTSTLHQSIPASAPALQYQHQPQRWLQQLESR